MRCLDGMTYAFIVVAVILISVGAVTKGGNDDGLELASILDRSTVGDSPTLAQPGNAPNLVALAPTPTPEAPGAADGLAIRTQRLPRAQEVQPSGLSILSEFLRGYDAHGGNPEWRTRFVEVVRPCEYYGWDVEWHRGDSRHLSVMQFHPDSWATAAIETGLSDPGNLYHVGANTAWWANAVKDPSGYGGWYECWRAG